MMRRFLPKTLFMRALLIVVLPTVLVQIVTAYIFYERHWSNVSRHMAQTLAGEVAFMAYQMARMPEEERDSLVWILKDTTGLSSTFSPDATLRASTEEIFPEFQEALQRALDIPFRVIRVGQDEVGVELQMPDGVLTLRTTDKRLQSVTTTLFMLWMVGSAAVFLCIAVVFLRNQVQPIRQLAEAAESFGKGQEMLDFKPRGAQEVRRAARAFLVMRERIMRQIRSRTEMLAGISHDLKTPLTRMKLALSFMPASPERTALEGDVTQMQQMVGEYLEFARGDVGEEAAPIALIGLLADVVQDYQRTLQPVSLAPSDDTTLELRVGAARRMLHNLIDNALRYGKEARVLARVFTARVEVWVEDRGPGIPPEQREEVFRPFVRLEGSRNPATGGVGLGLSIARDIARSHGGNIRLEEAEGGGLRVVIWLPR